MTPSTGRNGRQLTLFLWVQGVSFAMVCVILWLDEFADFPRMLSGATQTHGTAVEYILETGAILAVASVSMVITARLVGRVRALEGFLRICGWCRRVALDDAWVRFEEFVAREYDTQPTHGICPDCAKDLRREARAAVAGASGLGEKPSSESKLDTNLGGKPS